MSNFKTTTFLNLRKRAVKEPGNIVAVLPPDTIVENAAAGDMPGWLHVKTIIGNVPAVGYVSTNFLEATTLTLPQVEEIAALPEVHYPAGGRKITRNGTGRVFPLNETGLIKVDLRQIADATDRSAQIHNVVGYLDVERSARYAPNSKNTYCNIYAYDVAYCLGAFLPRVWWTSDAILKLQAGQDIQPLYDQTVTELTANRLTDWFEKYGPSFGWKRLFDLTALQNEVNRGKLGIIVAQRINMNNSGHIDVVVPETELLRAKRIGENVISPLQSQAGAKNKKYYTGINWWEDSTRFKKFGFWFWPSV